MVPSEAPLEPVAAPAPPPGMVSRARIRGSRRSARGDDGHPLPAAEERLEPTAAEELGGGHACELTASPLVVLGERARPRSWWSARPRSSPAAARLEPATASISTASMATASMATAGCAVLVGERHQLPASSAPRCGSRRARGDGRRLGVEPGARRA